jgi:hypothetical protein
VLTVPPLPAYYTSHYCEENALRLVADPALSDVDDLCVVFVSNAHKSVAMWGQRAAPGPGEPVLWDYHVFALGRWKGRATVLDLDTTLGFPLGLGAYCRGAFPRTGKVDPALEPMFRVVDAATAHATFASDRRHMRKDDASWAMPPPSLPPFRTATDTMNLWRFVDMGPGFVGRVLTLAELLAQHR